MDNLDLICAVFVFFPPTHSQVRGSFLPFQTLSRLVYFFPPKSYPAVSVLLKRSSARFIPSLTPFGSCRVLPSGLQFVFLTILRVFFPSSFVFLVFFSWFWSQFSSRSQNPNLWFLHTPIPKRHPLRGRVVLPVS